MRKIIILVVSIIILASSIYVALPWMLEKKIEMECVLSKPSEACVVRMRAMGHMWSRRDNLPRARIWYGRAAEHGDAAAMFHLAWVYEQMILYDFRKSLWRWVKSEDSNLSREIESIEERLNVKYSDSRESYIALAEYWYRLSADKGFAPSMNNLGQLYATSPLGRRDQEAAFRWHMAAAQAGNPVGAMNISVAYMYGDGVTPNVMEAKKWAMWTPTSGLAADLTEPTFERTKFFGSVVPADARAFYRAKARVGEPVNLIMESLKPDPSIPTFDDVK